jgi:uncharacterized protein (TIGR02453 family)
MSENLRYTLDFLRDLRANNDRAWFDQNRQRYDIARGHFEDLVTELIILSGSFEDLGGVTASDCIYRIYRDVRFSPDKTPYKTNLGAVIGKSGRKTIGRSYYIQIGPEGESFIAAGLYMPSKDQLELMRRAIADDSSKLRKILNKRDFKRYFNGLEGEQLKTAPQGYGKDHPDIDLLRYKQFLASAPLSEAQVLSEDLADYVVGGFKALKPLEAYIHEVLGIVP